MHVEVTFRNLNPREEVRRRALSLFNKLEKFLDPACTGQVLVSVEHGNAVIDLHVNTRGQTYAVHEEDPDLRTAIDRAFHNVEFQLRRAKEMRSQHRVAGEPRDGFDTPTEY